MSKLLTEQDFIVAAEKLSCEPAAIKAVSKVESTGSGFLDGDVPKILFEAHIFSKFTDHQFDAAHPTISSRTWNRALYKGGAGEYPRLIYASMLEPNAAVKAASWGKFQIMGFNHEKCGFQTPQEFALAMFDSERAHLEAFVSFLESTDLAQFLRKKHWKNFALGYNGPKYALNKYDEKLAKAYQEAVSA